MVLNGAKADLSTFLHESGHVFYNLMRRDAAKSEAVAARLAVINKWLGVRGKAEPTVEQQEKFARGFETYLREGKAPSIELRSAFDAFAAWLSVVYHKIRSLGVDLNDEVRAAMDRMLATEAELEAAEQSAGFTPDTSGMSEAEAARYLKSFREAHEEARDTLRQYVFRGLAKVFGEEREKIREQVTTATTFDRDYNTIEALRSGKRLDGAEVDPAVMERVTDGTTTGVKPKKLDREKVKAVLAAKKLAWTPAVVFQDKDEVLRALGTFVR